MSAHKTNVQMSTHLSITESRNMRQVVIVNKDHVTVRHPLCNVLRRSYVRGKLEGRTSHSHQQYNPIIREEDPGTLKSQMKIRSVNKRISPSKEQRLI